MTVRPWILVFVLVFLVAFSHAQSPTLDVSGTGVGSTGAVRFNDPSTIGKTVKPDVTYEDVRGRYLWDNDWHAGVLMLKNGGKFPLDKIRLNLYTQDVHYIGKDGIERVADKPLVRTVVLFGRDSAQILATFRLVTAFGAKTNELYQQMNSGELQLLKKVVSHVNKKQYDPSVGKTEYRFVAETTYYLLSKGKFTALDALNKNAVNATMPFDKEAEEWLGSHKNKLKSEEDIVAFLDYYNARPAQ